MISSVIIIQKQCILAFKTCEYTFFKKKFKEREVCFKCNIKLARS